MQVRTINGNHKARPPRGKSWRTRRPQALRTPGDYKPPANAYDGPLSALANELLNEYGYRANNLSPERILQQQQEDAFVARLVGRRGR